MPVAEAAPQDPGCARFIPEPAHYFIQRRLLGFPDDPLTYLQSPKTDEEMTARSIVDLKRKYDTVNSASGFFSDIYMPVIVNNPTDNISPVMAVKARKLVDYWTAGDSEEIKNDKITNLFHQFTTYPLGHPSFSDQNKITAGRREGIRANILFSHLFTPQQFYEGMSRISTSEKVLIQSDYLQLANIASAYARNLERSPANGVTIFPNPVSVIEVTELMNHIRDASVNFSYMPDIQAFNTALSEIAFLTIGETVNMYDVSTPLFLDAFHSRVDKVRMIPVNLLQYILKHDRPGQIDQLYAAIRNTHLANPDAIFWQSIGEFIERNSFNDDEVLSELANKLDHDEDDADPQSVGNASGALDTLVDLRGRLNGSHQKTTDVISPQRAANIAGIILKVFRDRTINEENEHYGYEPRARIRSLAAHLLNLGENYAHMVSDIGYQNLPPLIAQVIINTDLSEQVWINEYYPSGKDAFQILLSLLPKGK